MARELAAIPLRACRAPVAALMVVVCFACASSPPASPVPADVWASEAALAALPQGPEKATVIQYCAVCHELDRVVRAGGTEIGWVERINRMIRHGATIPRDRAPAVASYLAKAFPPRPRPQN